MSSDTLSVPPAHQALHSLVSALHPSATVSALLADKLTSKPFPLFPTSTSAFGLLQNARLKRRTARVAKHSVILKRPQPLTARERRKLQVHTLPRTGDAAKFETYEPLIELWVGYAHELVSLGGGAAAMAGRLAAGDLHGAVLEVVRCRCVDRVGIRGVVVKETRSVVEIVRVGGGIRTVPKEGTVFRVEVPLEGKVKVGDSEGAGGRGNGKQDEKGKSERKTEIKEVPRTMVFEIHGSMFMFRAAERAGRKFKSKPMPTL